jgi:hypothetical protein
MEKIDRTLHNRNDFFRNRRKVDPVAKQLAYSLENLNILKEFGTSIYPPNLIFFDESLKKEQTEQFINTFKSLSKTTTIAGMKNVRDVYFSLLGKCLKVVE